MEKCFTYEMCNLTFQPLWPATPLSVRLKASPFAPSDQVTSQPFFDKLLEFHVKGLICNLGSFRQLPFELLLVFPHVDAGPRTCTRLPAVYTAALALPSFSLFSFWCWDMFYTPNIALTFYPEHCDVSSCCGALSDLVYVLLWESGFLRELLGVCLLCVLLCI